MKKVKSGGRKRKEKLEALTVFSQRIQAREREERNTKKRERGGGGRRWQPWHVFGQRNQTSGGREGAELDEMR